MDTPPPIQCSDGFRRIAFIDLEASGLGSASFPTEIGWAIIVEDGSVESGSCLIRPPPRWTTYANAWSAASEGLTGITREMLDRDGLPPSEALKRFLDAVGKRDLFSDEPGFDSHWLEMLVDAAAISLGGRKLGDAKKLVEQMGLTLEFGEPIQALRARRAEAPRHRAEADARGLAAAFAKALTPAQSLGDETDHTENPIGPLATRS